MLDIPHTKNGITVGELDRLTKTCIIIGLQTFGANK
jgi:hypothetical protein